MSEEQKIKIDHAFRAIGSSLTTDLTKRIAGSFVSNVDRALNLYALPVHIAYWAGFLGECRGQAIWQALDTPRTEEEFHGQMKAFLFQNFKKASPDQQIAIKEVSKALFKLAIDDDLADGTETERGTRDWGSGVFVLNGISQAPHIEIGLRGVAESALLGAWTAFEVLSVDLWVASVNAHPMTLGEKALRAAKPRAEGRDINPTETQAKSDQSSITIDVLREHNFNLEDKLGTVIYEGRKFGFNRLSHIKHAYGACFGATTNPVFEAHDLTMLEAIRNSIIHRSGIVDKTFIDRVKADPRLSLISKGSALPVTANFAIQYMNSASKSGAELLKIVDAQLISNSG